MQVQVGTDFGLFVLTGFVAQIVGTTLGMGYGTICCAVLLTFGLPPLATSGSVNAASVVSSALSGWSQWRSGHVDLKTVMLLSLPGVVGVALGAACLSALSINLIKPLVACYLLFMILQIASRSTEERKRENPGARMLIPLALMAGMLGVVCGAGWGPLVTSQLVANGHSAKRSIGASNAARFFTTTASALILGLMLRSIQIQVVIGLIAGGLISIPFVRPAFERLPVRLLRTCMLLVLLFTAINMLKEPFSSATTSLVALVASRRSL